MYLFARLLYNRYRKPIDKKTQKRKLEMTMNKLTRRNLNPRGERLGDCVLRAFSALLENELSYDEIKKEIVKYDAYGKMYNQVVYFEKFANELGMVRIDNNSKNANEVKTFNRAIEFAEQFRISMVCIANDHAGYIDYKNGLIDTWDSRSKRIKYFYIYKEDAEMIGLKYKDSFSVKYTPIIDDKLTWIAKKGNKYIIESAK